MIKSIDESKNIKTIDDLLRELRKVPSGEDSLTHSFLENYEEKMKSKFNATDLEYINNNIDKNINTFSFDLELINNSDFFKEDCNKLLNLTLDLIYNIYSFKNKLNKKSDILMEYIRILEQNNKHNIPIFTTNYDPAVEQTTDFSNKYKIEALFDGDYEPKKYKGLKNFRKGQTQQKKKYINLFKLHGSVTWKSSNGEIVEISPKNVTNRHKGQDTRDVIIAPGDKLAERRFTEPYKTLFDSFEYYLSSTNILIVIGFAFEDDEITNLIQNYNPNTILVDPNPSNNAKNIANSIVDKKMENAIKDVKNEI